MTSILNKIVSLPPRKLICKTQISRKMFSIIPLAESCSSQKSSPGVEAKFICITLARPEPPLFLSSSSKPHNFFQQVKCKNLFLLPIAPLTIQPSQVQMKPKVHRGGANREGRIRWVMGWITGRRRHLKEESCYNYRYKHIGERVNPVFLSLSLIL